MIQSQIVPTITYLRSAIANLSNARLSSQAIDPAITFSIEQLLREAIVQVRRLEKLSLPSS